MGGCLPSTFFYILLESKKERRAADMTAYELLSLVLTVIGLLIGVTTLLLKLFAYLDYRYKRK